MRVTELARLRDEANNFAVGSLAPAALGASVLSNYSPAAAGMAVLGGVAANINTRANNRVLRPRAGVPRNIGN